MLFQHCVYRLPVYDPFHVNARVLTHSCRDLVFKGSVLSDLTKTVKDSGVAEGGFIVVMPPLKPKSTKDDEKDKFWACPQCR